MVGGAKFERDPPWKVQKNENEDDSHENDGQPVLGMPPVVGFVGSGTLSTIAGGRVASVDADG